MLLSPGSYYTMRDPLVISKNSSIYHSLVHQSLPCATCHPHNPVSTAIPKKPAIQIPPESETEVAPKLNSLSFSATSSPILRNVLTYTIPPSRPSQNVMANTNQMFGKNGNMACVAKITRLRHCRSEGRYNAWIVTKGNEDRDMKTPS
jgi:hypothetical protein